MIKKEPLIAPGFTKITILTNFFKSLADIKTVWIALIFVYLYFALLPVDIDSQAVVAYSGLAVMLAIRMFTCKRSGITKNLFLLISGFLSLRYFFWRTTHTLEFYEIVSFTSAVLLYLAEVYGICIHIVSMFVNASPLYRKPIPLSPDPELWPSVDVMIPSYNEDPNLLEVTILAALRIRYPKNKLKVYLLDDGGTVQKRNDKNPEKAEAALERHITLKSMCEKLGAIYLTREKNLHAKAGNVNSALQSTNGDLVLILDADHVPTVDILEKTVGWFEVDEKLFLMQTPHFFINPDPVERNLNTFQNMPSENEMFYRVIQRGLDFWGASFFCGSAAILRRKYLMEIGGISGDSITEDAETALELHSRGYHSAYIGYPLIAGLQPETYSGFVVQRTRWAQGMVQIFLLKNPLFKKGLSFAQRIGYFNSSFFWFFSYSRMIFMLAPAAYLIFGLQIYRTNFKQFVSYAVPHLLASLLTQNYLFSKVRWILVSELYELMQSVFSLPGIIKVFLNPRAPSFAVTPKGEQLDEDFISPLYSRFYLLFFLNFVCLFAGTLRLYYYPEFTSATAITMSWSLFNLILAVASFGVLREKKQRRSNPRMNVDIKASIEIGKETFPCQIRDVSVDGARVVFTSIEPDDIPKFAQALLKVSLASTNELCAVDFELCHRRVIDGQLSIGIQYIPKTATTKAQVVELMYGQSERWDNFLSDRSYEATVFQSLGFILRSSFLAMREHTEILTNYMIGYYYKARENFATASNNKSQHLIEETTASNILTQSEVIEKLPNYAIAGNTVSNKI
ncbi:MAG: UDP-forming cellulose synthase catalytic subunit [Blastocatellia bacterium]|nr:UDP-forming cellulose synthase catalytic subunit [Blastocatellia bacterium]